MMLYLNVQHITSTPVTHTTGGMSMGGAATAEWVYSVQFLVGQIVVQEYKA